MLETQPRADREMWHVAFSYYSSLVRYHFGACINVESAPCARSAFLSSRCRCGAVANLVGKSMCIVTTLVMVSGNVRD